MLSGCAVSAADMDSSDSSLNVENIGGGDDYFVESDDSSLECSSQDTMVGSSGIDDPSDVLEDNIGSAVGSDKLKSSPDSRALKGSGSPSNINNNSVYVITSANFSDYFDESNVLKSNYSDRVLVFDGLFDDLGVLKICSNNTFITSNNSLFKNTVFDLEASSIVLSNINMVLDKEFEDNEYAAIFCHGDNITVYNCSIVYDAPANRTAFGIYSDGHDDDFVGLSLINSTINFKGHANFEGYNYGVLLRNTHDSLIYGNNISCDLPLRRVSWFGSSGSYGQVSMDTVASLACDFCENLTLSNNYIYSNVNFNSLELNAYPTLDTMILYGCSYSLIEENEIISHDFITPLGYDNYLQGVDLYNLNDVTVIGNNITIFTNGGKPCQSTAYPVQINGPVYNVKIAFNNLTTFNHGPNCGIYSQNFFGDTFIDIISNFINVTGDATAGTFGDWALVTGIEVQDTGDNILNNTIIVNNLGNYKSNAYVYGISYVQNTGGGHTYNIQYNNITTNGNYGVKLIGDVKDSTTYNSTISNNVINTHTTSNRTGASTNRQVEGPSGTLIRNNTNGNPRNVMSEDYYPDWLKDYVRNGSGRGTGDFAWLNRILNPSSNGTGFSDAVGNGTSHSGSGNARGNGHGSHDGDVSGNGTDSSSDTVLGSNHDAAPGVGGDASPSVSAASPSDSGSSAANPNAYEIDEHDNVASKSSDYLQLGIICIVALLLLIIGYKRQKDKEEEE